MSTRAGISTDGVATATHALTVGILCPRRGGRVRILSMFFLSKFAGEICPSELCRRRGLYKPRFCRSKLEVVAWADEI